MFDPFLKYIDKHTLFKKSDKLLLAVSGGVDSIVLVDLINRAGFSFSIAHCNFKLRDKESDSDEEFVQQIANKFNVDFHCKHFDTQKFADENKISIQMAARELRFSWFKELSSKRDYNQIVVASHLNDSMETFFLNATKGTGISGLSGIAPRNENIVRPLLFVTKQQIAEYAKEKNLEWREDSSNDSIKYERNLIRHKVVPTLKEINPSLESTFDQTLQNLHFAEFVFREAIDSIKDQMLFEKGDHISIDFKKLKVHPFSDRLLFELVKEFGFTYSDCCDIVDSSQTGKEFFAAKHRLIVNRNELLLQETAESTFKSCSVQKTQTSISHPLRLDFSIKNTPNKINPSSNVAQLDLGKLEFPLELRPWEVGDSFYPLGMNGKKKVSDFLIDNKLSKLEKENTFVLTSNNEIVWIVGQRIDDRFKIKSSTTEVFQLELKK